MSDYATIVGHVTLLVATLAGFYVQWKREERRHRWQQEQFQQVGTLIKKNGHAQDQESGG